MSMTEKIALGCKDDCGFLIAGKAHCFESLEPLIEAYNNECPNCGRNLEKKYVTVPKYEENLLHVSTFPEVNEE